MITWVLFPNVAKRRSKRGNQKAECTPGDGSRSGHGANTRTQWAPSALTWAMPDGSRVLRFTPASAAEAGAGVVNRTQAHVKLASTLASTLARTAGRVEILCMARILTVIVASAEDYPSVAHASPEWPDDPALPHAAPRPRQTPVTRSGTVCYSLGYERSLHAPPADWGERAAAPTRTTDGPCTAASRAALRRRGCSPRRSSVDSFSSRRSGPALGRIGNRLGRVGGHCDCPRQRERSRRDGLLPGDTRRPGGGSRQLLRRVPRRDRRADRRQRGRVRARLRRLGGGTESARFVKALLDEQLSVEIAQELRRRGGDVEAVTERPELLRASDERLMALAMQEDRAVVTNNLRHFRPIAAGSPAARA